MSKSPNDKNNPTLHSAEAAQEAGDVHIPGPEHSLVKPGEVVITILDKTGQKAVETVNYQSILPRNFTVSENLDTNMVSGKPVSVGQFSNFSFREVPAGHSAKIGVAGVRSNDQLVKIVLLDLDINFPVHAINVPNILRDQLDSMENSDQPKVLNAPTLPKELQTDIDRAGLMAMTIDPKEKILSTAGIGNNVRCYVIRDHKIREVPRWQRRKYRLKAGDIVFAATAGMIETLINSMTRKSYETEKLGEHPLAEKSFTELPEEFVTHEAANQIMGAIAAAYRHPLKSTQGAAQTNRAALTDKFLSVDEERHEDTSKPRRFETTALMYAISKAYRKAMTKVSPKKLIHTAAFVVYQVPES